jgi:hypothetical protein
MSDILAAFLHILVKFFPAFRGMKDIVTSIFSDIVHYLKQIAISVKANEQKFVGKLRKQAVKHHR